MAVKIRLKRLGKIRTPYYRVVIVDGRQKRDGRVIEEVGKYHPTEEPSLIDLNSERIQYWLGVGAQPSEPVFTLLKITGDWQKYKKLPGAEGTLKVSDKVKDAKAAIEEAENEAVKRLAAAAEEKEKSEKEAAAAKEAEEAPAEAEAPAEEAAAAETSEAPADAPAPEEAPAETEPAAEADSESNGS